jgi:hypothetical protein
MDLPKEFTKEFAQFPEVLRHLVEAELAAGNSVTAMEHGFPAAPCGASIRLAGPVTTRPREKTAELAFYDRNNSSYAGEFTDAQRHFFVLEPPRPPEPAPDMDAIRAELEARYAAANASLETPDWVPTASGREEPDWTPAEREIRNRAKPEGSSAYAKFRASMEINYDKWKEGIGYDIDLIRNATPEEQAEIEYLLVNRPIDDWRDVEALAALDTPKARKALQSALHHSDHKVRTAIANYSPDLVPDDERTASLVSALEGAEIFGGLSEALDQVEDFHPPEIMEALFRGVLRREGGTAVHFAAMLMFLHGMADSAFDWEQRPFFLRFNTENMTEREAVFRELCGRIQVDAEAKLLEMRA